MLVEAIKNRKSIRKYTDQVVTDEQINTLLEAAMCAPSAHNKQPWEFCVISDRGLLDEIAEKHKYGKMMSMVNKAIVVLGNTDVSNKTEFIYCDCSAATQNMLIQATAMNLGTVWCAIAPSEELKELFSNLLELPSNILPVAIVAVGYHEDTKGPMDKFKQEKIHYNKY